MFDCNISLQRNTTKEMTSMNYIELYGNNNLTRTIKKNNKFRILDVVEYKNNAWELTSGSGVHSYLVTKIDENIIYISYLGIIMMDNHNLEVNQTYIPSIAKLIKSSNIELSDFYVNVHNDTTIEIIRNNISSIQQENINAPSMADRYCKDPLYIDSIDMDESRFILSGHNDNITDGYIILDSNSINILSFNICVIYKSDTSNILEYQWMDVDNEVYYGNTGLLIKHNNFVSQNYVSCKIKCDNPMKITLKIKRIEGIQLVPQSCVGHIEHYNLI